MKDTGLARKMRVARHERRLTQEEAAKQAGLGYQTFATVERTGKGWPSTLRKVDSWLSKGPSEAHIHAKRKKGRRT